MTEPKVCDRFVDAAAALEGLESTQKWVEQDGNNRIDKSEVLSDQKISHQRFQLPRSIVFCRNLLVLKGLPYCVNF